VVNDSVVAHVGALGGDPGVVAVCGTVSSVLGITADGEQVRNYECDHYAAAAARHIGTSALHALLAGEAPEHWPLGERLLDCWGCASVRELRTAVREDGRFDTSSSGNPLDRVAPLVRAAADGVPTGRAICDEAIAEVLTGVRLVGGSLAAPVAVSSAGSVLRSEYVDAEIRRRIAETEGYHFVEPAMSPVGGAVFDAIDRVAPSGEAVRARVTEHPVGRV